MCISCGCGEGADDHGSTDNITGEAVVEELTDADIERAAEAQGITVEEVRRNIEATRKRNAKTR